MISQGTDEWKAMRLGKVTASRVADVIAETKSGPAASRATYMGELIAERLTGTWADKFTSAAMQHGTEYEAEARKAYCFYNDVVVQEIPFVDHPTISMSGASPDGLIGNVGGLEIKCPNTSTHIEYVLTGSIPKKYITQMMWQMACCELSYVDFVSYDPRLPEELRYWNKRIHRDDETIGDLEVKVSKFIAEIDEKIDALRAYSTIIKANAA
jgi:putative phage-type endonuclease